MIPLRSRRALILSIICLTTICGCATVTTTTELRTTPAKGLTYFLPKRLASIKATRTPLKKEEIEKKLAAMEAEVSEAKKSKATLEGDLKKLAVDLTAEALSEDGKRALTDNQAVLTARAKNLETAMASKNKEIGDLRQLLAQLPASACAYSYDIKIEAGEIVADTTKRYIANIRHIALRDDAQTFKVSASGLLNSADVAATDRSGDLLVEAIGAIGAFDMPSKQAFEMFVQPALPPDSGCETQVRAFNSLLDPGFPASGAAVTQELQKAGWPFEIRTHLLGAEGGLPAVVATDINVDGLAYRTPAPAQITIFQKDGSSLTPVQSSIVLVPQAGPIGYIPLRSSAFVKTSDVITFENGMLTSWTANRPSEVLEVVRLPVRALKALISIPADLIKLRVDYSSSEKSMAEAYAAQIRAQQELKELRTCVDAAEAAGSSVSACFAE